MEKPTCAEVLLWSIALPGFGQILNGKYVKGILLVGLEFLINVQSHLNDIIISSFHGEIEKSIGQTNYEWLMFYPCVYMFGIWDAYKDAGGGSKPYAVFPFAFGAFFATIGVIYSVDFFGAVWNGIIGLFAGVGIGIVIKTVLRKRLVTKTHNGVREEVKKTQDNEHNKKQVN